MDDEPMFRVIRGAPTPDELAALVGVLWTRRQAAAQVATVAAPVSRWRAGTRPGTGALPQPGPGAWASAR